MENASKALIIAGAILLSILIIALGIFIFNAAKGAVNTDALDATEIETFNGQFTMYEGTKVLGSNVKALISACVSNAGANAESVERLPDIIYVDSKTSAGPAVTLTGTGVTKQLTQEQKKYITIDANKYEIDANIESKVNQTNIAVFNQLKSKISNTHYYEVTCFMNESGLVTDILIAY